MTDAVFPLIVLFCIIGSYSINTSIFDVVVTVTFGMVGYLFRKFDYEGAPLTLAFVLGPIFEIHLRRSLLVSGGSFLIFFTRPISAVFISLALILLLTSLIPYFTKAKKKYDTSTKDD